MNGTRATIAIVRREFTAWRLVGIAACFVLGFASLPVLSPLPESPVVWLLFILSLVCGVAAASTVRTRDESYIAAPLYGRQLARAFALVVILCAFVYPLGLIGGLLAYNFGVVDPPYLQSTYNRMIIGLWAGNGLALAFASVAAALVSLSATLRNGFTRIAYQLSALAISFLILAGWQIATHFADPWIINAHTFVQTETRQVSVSIGLSAIAAAISGVVGFIALRAFGEALARYDPI